MFRDFSIDPDKPLNTLYIRAGSSSQRTGGTVHEIKRIARHPSYSKNSCTISHDLSLITVYNAFPFGDNVKFIQVADEDPKDGEVVAVAGWGRTNVSKKEAENDKLWYPDTSSRLYRFYAYIICCSRDFPRRLESPNSSCLPISLCGIKQLVSKNSKLQTF